MSRTKNTKMSRSDWIALTSIFITIILAVFVYNQNQKINALSKGQMANDILISSPNMDTINKLGDNINISIDVVSNYDGAMPVLAKVSEIRLNGEKVISEYKHTAQDSSQREKIILKDDMVSFNFNFEAEESGEYQLDYIIYYNYPQEESYKNGKLKLFTLKLQVEK